MQDFKPGHRVQLNDGRKGTVRFAGQTEFQVGEWLGVELDEKTGKNDGSVKDVRYFDCPDAYGMFVKPMMARLLPPAPAQKSVTKPGTSAIVKKPPRPSSFNPGAPGRASTSGDTTLNKRRSLNAPSPSPVPKTSRPSSVLRVSFYSQPRNSCKYMLTYSSHQPNPLRNS